MPGASAAGAGASPAHPGESPEAEKYGPEPAPVPLNYGVRRPEHQVPAEPRAMWRRGPPELTHCGAQVCGGAVVQAHGGDETTPPERPHQRDVHALPRVRCGARRRGRDAPASGCCLDVQPNPQLLYGRERGVPPWCEGY